VKLVLGSTNGAQGSMGSKPNSKAFELDEFGAVLKALEFFGGA
jgi:hypothetical protein